MTIQLKEWTLSSIVVVWLISMPTPARAAREMWPESAPLPVVVSSARVKVVADQWNGTSVGTAIGNVAVGGATGTVEPGGHRYRVSARNVSHKEVLAIEVDFEFYTPFEELYATERVQFAPSEGTWRWKPKLAFKLEVLGAAVHHKQNNWHYRATLSRVRFKDGTTWENPARTKAAH